MISPRLTAPPTVRADFVAAAALRFAGARRPHQDRRRLPRHCGACCRRAGWRAAACTAPAGGRSGRRGLPAGQRGRLGRCAVVLGRKAAALGKARRRVDGERARGGSVRVCGARPALASWIRICDGRRLSLYDFCTLPPRPPQGATGRARCCRRCLPGLSRCGERCCPLYTTRWWAACWTGWCLALRRCWRRSGSRSWGAWRWSGTCACCWVSGGRGRHTGVLQPLLGQPRTD
jgi:hypothetical protein